MNDSILTMFSKVRFEVEPLLHRAFLEAGELTNDHPLTQEGLSNGFVVINNYLSNSEAGLALEHLIYLIEEPPLHISSGCYQKIKKLSAVLGYSPEIYKNINYTHT